MAINLVETIQKNLGFPELQKIDLNTQEVKKSENISVQNYLPQAAIPVVLLGLYKYSRTEEANTELLKGESHQKLLKTIFGKTTQSVIDKVASYTGNTSKYTADRMEIIAWEALHTVSYTHLTLPTNREM